MPETPKQHSKAHRILTRFFWIILWALAALGLVFFGLVIAGMVQFATLECGPRSDWTQANYSACSDIDETNPIFFLLGVQTTLPLIASLALRALLRRVRRSG